jgi:drug/metabolite transporter (DMT)-like permease
VSGEEALLVATGAGLGGMFGWGFADFYAKLTIDRIGDVVSLAWAHIFGTILLLCVAVGHLALTGAGPGFPVDVMTWLWLAFFGVLQAVVYLLLYSGFEKGQVAVLNPVFASFSGVVALISITILGESASALKVAALLLVFGGILLLSLDRSTLRIRMENVPGLKEVGLATACATV